MGSCFFPVQESFAREQRKRYVIAIRYTLPPEQTKVIIGLSDPRSRQGF